MVQQQIDGFLKVAFINANLSPVTNGNIGISIEWPFDYYDFPAIKKPVDLQFLFPEQKEIVLPEIIPHILASKILVAESTDIVTSLPVKAIPYNKPVGEVNNDDIEIPIPIIKHLKIGTPVNTRAELPKPVLPETPNFPFPFLFPIEGLLPPKRFIIDDEGDNEQDPEPIDDGGSYGLFDYDDIVPDPNTGGPSYSYPDSYSGDDSSLGSYSDSSYSSYENWTSSYLDFYSDFESEYPHSYEAPLNDNNTITIDDIQNYRNISQIVADLEVRVGINSNNLTTKVFLVNGATFTNPTANSFKININQNITAKDGIYAYIHELSNANQISILRNALDSARVNPKDSTHRNQFLLTCAQVEAVSYITQMLLKVELRDTTYPFEATCLNAFEKWQSGQISATQLRDLIVSKILDGTLTDENGNPIVDGYSDLYDHL